MRGWRPKRRWPATPRSRHLTDPVYGFLLVCWCILSRNVFFPVRCVLVSVLWVPLVVTRVGVVAIWRRSTSLPGAWTTCAEELPNCALLLFQRPHLFIPANWSRCGAESASLRGTMCLHHGQHPFVLLRSSYAQLSPLSGLHSTPMNRILRNSRCPLRRPMGNHPTSDGAMGSRRLGEADATRLPR